MKSRLSITQAAFLLQSSSCILDKFIVLLYKQNAKLRIYYVYPKKLYDV